MIKRPAIIIITNKSYSIWGQCKNNGDILAETLNDHYRDSESVASLAKTLKTTGIEYICQKEIKRCWNNLPYNNGYQNKPLSFMSFDKMLNWIHDNFDCPEYVILLRVDKVNENHDYYWSDYPISSLPGMEELFKDIELENKSSPKHFMQAI